jgi:hypothetical protein
LADTYHSHYARDIKQLEALKPLEGLRPSLLDLFASDALVGEISSWESRVGLPFDAITSFTTGSVKGESYPFSLDLAAAVCHLSLLPGARVDSAQT